MRKLFPGYFKTSKEVIKEDWNNFIFVFDTNVLLNIYRYSESTQVEYLRLLDKIKDRSWLPNRVVEEYLENRLPTIEKQEKAYDDMLNSISSLKTKLDNSRQHPFASQETMASVDTAFDKLTAEFTKNKSSYTKKIHDDDIQEKYLNMYDERVGESFDLEELKAIFTEGEERYKNLVPPGYKDTKKQGTEGRVVDFKRKFGDLIIWKEVLNYSSSNDKGIIFVTDDRKEDWWNIFNGKTIGPRFELIKEFEEVTNNRIHIYTSDRFLELARTNLGQTVSSSILDEIRESHIQETINNVQFNLKDIDHQDIPHQDILYNKFDTLTENELDTLIENNFEELSDKGGNDINQNITYTSYPNYSINEQLYLLCNELMKEKKINKEIYWKKQEAIDNNNELENKYKSEGIKNLARLTSKNRIKQLHIQDATNKAKINALQEEIIALKNTKKHLDEIRDINN
ncbi:MULTISPECIES: PIN-like domain-containing protein [Cobetia]|uniref:PIN-like domain-containing protein n=1 Tax=Cobetia TaxID=204286 RepID=UPI000CDB1331|nr:MULTISPECIES: PIN-like domain-containing protein [Cobetia]